MIGLYGIILRKCEQYRLCGKVFIPIRKVTFQRLHLRRYSLNGNDSTIVVYHGGDGFGNIGFSGHPRIESTIPKK